MKILFVNNQYRLGGAETVIHQLRRGFPSARLAVANGKTFPPDVDSLYPRWLARLSHTRLHSLIEAAAPRAPWTDRAFRGLASAPCDIIHLHNFHGHYASVESLAHLAQRKPVVWTFHALWGVTGGCDHPRDCRRYLEVCGRCPQLGRWPLPLLDNTPTELARKIKYLAPLPLHVIAPSHWLADVVRESRVGRKWRVHHIPNAVDAAFCETLERTPRTSSAELNILIVNRNFRDEQKGFPILQSALQIAAGTLQDIPTKLVLVGENADWAAEQLPGWNCECVGYVSDTTTLARHHRAAGIFLFASPAENFPCAVLEAMAAGSCVVATPTGGVVGQIEDGVSGILATEISGPALAAALVRAATDTPLRKATGEAACARVHKLYGEAQFFARHREVYEEVLETWRPQA